MAAALRHLRQSTLPRVVWAYAVCINQGDTSEKNHQVQKMGLIYSKASVVLSWLGIAADNSDLAIEILQRMADKIEANAGRNDMIADAASTGNDSGQNSCDPQLDLMLSHNQISRPEALTMLLIKDIEELFVVDKTMMTRENHASPTWKAIDSLLKRPYWKRLWVLQEMVLAKNLTICCGTRSISWHHLRTAVEDGVNSCASSAGRPYFDGKVWAVLQFITNASIMAVSSCRRMIHKSHPIFDYFIWTGLLEATNPRDYVYGILGMAKSDMPVDYDAPVETIYHEQGIAWYEWAAVNAVIMEPIQYAGIGHHQCPALEDLPSWIPHLSCIGQAGGSWVSLEKRLAAGSTGPTRYSDPVIEGKRLLRVLGGVIDEVSDIWHVSADSEEEPWNISLWVNQMLSSGSVWQHPTKVPPLQVLFRTLLCDVDTRNQTRRLSFHSLSCQDLLAGFLMNILGPRTLLLAKKGWDHLELQMLLQQRGLREETFWLTFLGSNGKTSLDELPSLMRLISRNSGNFHHFWQQAELSVNGNCVFRTAKGYLGIGPRYLQKKDQLVLLPSYTTPFLLRQSGNYRTLVGTCFALGLMRSDEDGHYHKWHGPLQELRLR
ncbi:hypothetical protein ACJZ2D_001817 [Fusarium nematophilum]